MCGHFRAEILQDHESCRNMQYNAGYILRGQGFLIERSEARPVSDAEIDSGDFQLERQEEDDNDDVKRHWN